MAGKVLTRSEVDAKREALYEYVDAAARHGQVLPSMERVGQMLRISHSRVRTLMAELHASRRIYQTITFVKGVGNVRIVRITATGCETAARQPQTAIGKAARALASYDQDKRKEGEARDRAIYGGVIEDVRYLRRRGWGIHKEEGGFRVGRELLGAADIVSKAARERRLAGISQ